MKGLDAYLTPPEESEYCDVCGNDLEQCICPECPICYEQGNPDCYDPSHKRFHGMVISQAQKESAEHWKGYWEEQYLLEQDYMDFTNNEDVIW